jgi:hypothetical protein
MVAAALAGGAAATILGGIFGSSAAKKAARARQAALNQLTDLQRREFDFRAAETRAGMQRTGALQDQGYAAGAANEAATFDDILAQIRAGFDEQLALDDGAFGRSIGAQRETADQMRAARGGRNVVQDRARSAYDAAIGAENARQAGFRSAAEGAAGDTIARSGSGGFATDRASAVAQRLADLAVAVSSGVPAENLTTTSSLAPLVQAEMAKRISAGRERAMQIAGAGANLSGYSDAFDAGGRRIADLGDRLTALDLQARASASALPAEMQAQQAIYRNAAANADDTGSMLSANLGDRLSLIDSDRSARGDINQRFRSGMTDIIGQRGDRNAQILGNFYDRSLTSESDYTGERIGASQSYENTNRELTNYQIGNTTGSNFLGDMLSTIGPMAMSAGISQGVGTKLSNLFRTPSLGGTVRTGARSPLVATIG